MRTFTVWQILSGLVWSIGITLAGWGVGSHISNVDHYLLPIVAAMGVLIFVIMIGLALTRSRAGIALGCLGGLACLMLAWRHDRGRGAGSEDPA